MTSDRPTDQWTFTWHADQRALQRGVARAEVLTALASPDLTYPQHSHGPGRHVIRQGRLRLVVHPVTRTVITVITTTPGHAA